MARMRRSWKSGFERGREDRPDPIRGSVSHPGKRYQPEEVFFITEIAEGEGGAEGQVDVEAFYDAESAAERLDYRAKDLFNDLLDEIVHLRQEEDEEDEHGMTKNDYLMEMESAKDLINKGEYQGALDILSHIVMNIFSQASWTTELLQTEELK